jgi:phosphoglucosamine mutase
VREGADFGIAHDGDSDRCLAVDGKGAVVDGDQIMTILALGYKERGKLAANTIVATVMSNLGFFRAMKAAGIEVITTSVGDRYVLEKMLEGNFSLGGEQSGHLIIREHANTGDGILTALALAQEVVRTGKSLEELASAMQRFPQVLINVSGVAKDKLSQSTVIESAVAKAQAQLADAGRVLLRASGTENLIRVMVEASSDNLAQEVATSLAAVVKAELEI